MDKELEKMGGQVVKGLQGKNFGDVMVAGGGMVFIWKLLIRPVGGVFGIYELLPAFIFSCLAIIIFSLLTKKESQEILDEFEYVRTYQGE